MTNDKHPIRCDSKLYIDTCAQKVFASSLFYAKPFVITYFQWRIESLLELTARTLSCSSNLSTFLGPHNQSKI